MITFDRFWQYLESRNITTYSLEKDYHINKSIISRLKNNKNITMNTLNDLCNLLDCDITDILEYRKDL